MVKHMARRGRIAQARALGARLVRAGVNAVLPPTCLITDETVSNPGDITPEAWGRLTFVAEPWCVRCGLPFSFDPGPDVECAACVARAPVFDTARSALVYDEEARRLVLEFKHAGRTDGVAAFARWMASVAGPRLTATDLIVPTPLHASRLRRRGFNQAGLLAHAVARLSGRAWSPDVLRRTRRTPSQGAMSASARARNVAGAFDVPPRHADRLARARVTLIDDVHTTGATLNACARALKRAGACEVHAITLARVVRPRDALI